MKLTYLDFEKRIEEADSRIEELRALGEEGPEVTRMLDRLSRKGQSLTQIGRAHV